nr:reverse transcriptase domain-containing protein [Tanacetum cinerariifolium]
ETPYELLKDEQKKQLSKKNEAKMTLYNSLSGGFHDVFILDDQLPRNIRVYEGNKDLEDHLVIMEYLVKISKKEHILELKQRHLKITVLTSNTSYPSRKIWRICACTSQKTTKKTRSDICRNNKRNESQGRNNVKVINMIKGWGSRKRPFEGERFSITYELTFPAIPQNQLTDEPIILEGMIEDNPTKKMRGAAGRFLERNVPPFGNNRPLSNHEKGRKNKTVLMEFALIKCCSPYNFIIKRTRMRSLKAVGSTIYSMIKFPTNREIMTMETSREALWECIQLERV